MFEAHPDDPTQTRWTGYLDVAIKRSYWLPFLTNMLIDKCSAHFSARTLASLGHDGSELGYCAKDVYKRICTPYCLTEQGEVLEGAAAS